MGALFWGSSFSDDERAPAIFPIGSCFSFHNHVSAPSFSHPQPVRPSTENPQQAERLLTQLVEGKGKGEGDEEEGDPRACYSLAMLLSARLQQQQPPKGGGRGQQGRGDAGERVYALLRRAVQGGVLPAVHNLANLLAQGQG